MKVIFLSKDLIKLSLIMIVKDEESCINRCLDSVKNIVDEMIIVDTGSTDKTLEICHSYNAQVFSFKWNNNFAEARNFGLDRATGDWLLWLDADEEAVFKADNGAKLTDNIAFDNYDVLSVPLVNFYGNKATPDQIVKIAQPRLFRNHMDFRFENKIHEWLNISSAFEHNRVGFLDMQIYHYGYMDSCVENKCKYKRNVELLLRELEENRDNAWTHYYLATEYYRVKDYKNAFAYTNQSISLFLSQGVIPPPSMLYSLKYSILIETGSWDGAWPSIKSAVKLFPDYVDLKYYMGVILYHKKTLRAALECFNECIIMGEDSLNYLTHAGLGSFRAWFFKGLCLEELKNEEQAIQAYQQSLKLSDGFEPSRVALQKIKHYSTG